jgi:hypothetical protein
MPCADDRQWILDRIEATKALIIKTEEAISALSLGANSYTFDTGQSRQTVTRANLATVRGQLDSLENRLATLQARLCGSTVTFRSAG